LENVGKPEETHLISEVAGLAKPEDVGKKMVKEAIKSNPPFAVTFDLDAWMLSNLTAGMGPTTVFGDLVAQIAAMGFFRVISLFYLNAFWGMLRNYKAKKTTPSSLDDKTKEEYGATTTRTDTDQTEKSD
jgi:3-dehydrosphinganine reductase